VGNVVLMGDAAHTTHFTIGSGTRLAMEDAMGLAEALAAQPTPDAALASYQATRQQQLRRAQREAARSARWFEHVPRYVGQLPQNFAHLMQARRSPVMGYLPVGAYLALTQMTNNVPAIQTLLRHVVSKF
jgi:anthraniloyl-CoA monooxygenase